MSQDKASSIVLCIHCFLSVLFVPPWTPQVVAYIKTNFCCSKERYCLCVMHVHITISLSNDFEVRNIH